MKQVEIEMAALRLEASTAREEAANLRGQVEVLQNQTSDQLRALTSTKEKSPPPSKPGK